MLNKLILLLPILQCVRVRVYSIHTHTHAHTHWFLNPLKFILKDSLSNIL